MVKAIAALPLVAIGAWLWRWRGANQAARFGAVAVVPVAVGYAFFGGYAALRPLLDAGNRVSRASAWRLILHVLPRDAHNFAARHLGALVIVAVMVVTAAAVVRPLREGSPSAAALNARSSRTVFLLVESTALLVAYQYQVRTTRDFLDDGLFVSEYLAAALLVAMSAALVVMGAHAARRPLAEPAG
jgi:hypothetical protein